MASPNLAEILDLVRDLSPRDKLGLVSELVNDLEGPEDEGWAEAWREELDRRRNDPAERTGAAGDEVIARASGAGSAVMRLTVRRSAEQELTSAARWYEGKQPGLGGEYLDAIEAAFRALREAPEACPTWEGTVYRSRVSGSAHWSGIVQAPSSGGAFGRVEGGASTHEEEGLVA